MPISSYLHNTYLKILIAWKVGINVSVRIFFSIQNVLNVFTSVITHDIPIKIVRSKWLYFSYLSPVVKRASAEKINDAAPPSSILYTDSSLNSPQAFVMPKQQQKLKSLLPMLDMCGKWIGQTSTTKRSHPYNTNVTLRKRGERRRTDWKEAKIKLCHLGINMSVVVWKLFVFT